MTHFLQDKTMTSFQVSDMTCGHCVNAITQAVRAVDKAATVQIDLAAHRVDIKTGTVDAAGLAKAISNAGYTPIALESGSLASAPAATAKRGGCCCR
jgi:copper chaperone